MCRTFPPDRHGALWLTADRFPIGDTLDRTPRVLAADLDAQSAPAHRDALTESTAGDSRTLARAVLNADHHHPRNRSSCHHELSLATGNAVGASSRARTRDLGRVPSVRGTGRS